MRMLWFLENEGGRYLEECVDVVNTWPEPVQQRKVSNFQGFFSFETQRLVFFDRVWIKLFFQKLRNIFFIFFCKQNSHVFFFEFLLFWQQAVFNKSCLSFETWLKNIKLCVFKSTKTNLVNSRWRTLVSICLSRARAQVTLTQSNFKSRSGAFFRQRTQSCRRN